MNTLTIIGGGSGGLQFLTGEAREVIASAERIYACKRLGDAFEELNSNIVCASYGEIKKILAGDRSCDAAVIVSGDTGFFSMARVLKREFGGQYNIHMLPGISSMQALCARLGVGYEDLQVISTHGRDTPVLGPVSYHARTLVLTSGGEDARRILESLCEADLGDVSVTVGEALGGAGERIVTGTASSLLDKPIGELVVLLLENSRAAVTFPRLRDEEFIRGNVPMTKESVRALAVDRLEIEPEEIVCDIGAGTGSVSVALARKATKGLVYAVERSEEGLSLIHQNRRRLGTHNIVIVPGTAPEALGDLPAPAKVFIGGSGGNINAILEALTLKSKSMTVCIAAITLEGIAQAVSGINKAGFDDVEVECVNTAKSREAGGYHLMMAQNPVYLISGRWKR